MLINYFYKTQSIRLSRLVVNAKINEQQAKADSMELEHGKSLEEIEDKNERDEI